jgi:hypothetical protein
VSEETKDVKERIANHLSDALFRSKQARGIVIGLEMEDGTSWTYRAGSLVCRMGLIEALRKQAQTDWEASRTQTPEEAEGEGP